MKPAKNVMKKRERVVLKWKDFCPGVYELYITESNMSEPIAKIKDWKKYSPKIWENRMMETPKSFTYSFQNQQDVQLVSENIDEAKKELEIIIVKECRGFVLEIPKQLRQLSELEEYYKNITGKITVGQSENI